MRLCSLAVIAAFVAGCMGIQPSVTVAPTEVPASTSMTPPPTVVPATIGTPRARPTEEAKAPPTETALLLDDCRRLDLPEDRGETNTYLDLEGGVLEISYLAGDADRTISIAFLDPFCLSHPQIGWVIEHVVPEGLADAPTGCDDLRNRLASGQVIVRGEPISVDDIGEYVDRWCS